MEGMKKTYVSLMGEQLPVREITGAKCVSIYEYTITNEASLIVRGTDLKDACLKWLDKTGDISEIVLNMEFHISETTGEELKLEIETAGAAFDEYVASLTGEELFAMIAHGHLNDFVDWSLVEDGTDI